MSLVLVANSTITCESCWLSWHVVGGKKGKGDRKTKSDLKTSEISISVPTAESSTYLLACSLFISRFFTSKENTFLLLHVMYHLSAVLGSSRSWPWLWGTLKTVWRVFNLGQCVLDFSTICQQCWGPQGHDLDFGAPWRQCGMSLTWPWTMCPWLQHHLSAVLGSSRSWPWLWGTLKTVWHVLDLTLDNVSLTSRHLKDSVTCPWPWTMCSWLQHYLSVQILEAAFTVFPDDAVWLNEFYLTLMM